MTVESCTRPTVTSKELDFRPELISSHYRELLENGLNRDRSREIAVGIAQRELTYTFLERYCKERLVHYSYAFQGDQMVSPGYEQLGEVTDRYKRAVDEKKSQGKDYSREQAEFEGVQAVKNHTVHPRGEPGSTQEHPGGVPEAFLIISPPPPDGSYSFYYFGQYNPQTRIVDMWAWRNEKTLGQQFTEADQVSPGSFSPEVNPNDFLRQPIFSKYGHLDEFRPAIADMPLEEKFAEAKKEDFSKYEKAINLHAIMLTDLIESGAGTETFRDAQRRIEMDFTKWVSGEEVRATATNLDLTLSENHNRFKLEVNQDLARFVMMGYKTDQYACGSCGNSVLSTISTFNNMSQLQTSMPELFSSYIPCPNCGESLKTGSNKCNSCKITKSEYEFKKSYRG